MNRIRCNQKRERGGALIEFAVAIPLFLLLVFGLIDMGRAVWTYNSLGYVARGAVRYAAVRSNESGDPADAAKIEAWITAQNTGLDPDKMTVTANWTPSNTPGATVQVDVGYDFRPVVALAGFLSIPLASTATLTVSF